MATSGAVSSPTGLRPLPPWIRTRPPTGDRYAGVRTLLLDQELGTVCREARCPNLPECWSAGTATLMLLGTDCSRRCGFCAVRTHWGNGAVDASEPDRVARAVERWGLKYVVLTQVCRDDLPDGGASILADSVRAIRTRRPTVLTELLVGDLGDSERALASVLAARPDVLGHNLETVERLSPKVRDRRAGYRTSLRLLARARSLGGPTLITKSSIMLGLGETDHELAQAMADLRAVGVDLLTLGQYLQPSPAHVAVARYVPPAEFDRYGELAREAGFRGVESGPMVRSSYHAEELYASAGGARGG
ncbi:MAG: lipoyl synthase [Thermoplasmata archaeon]|nr:lipoyl synthase [Thermoplasmata archaeon]